MNTRKYTFISKNDPGEISAFRVRGVRKSRRPMPRRPDRVKINLENFSPDERSSEVDRIHKIRPRGKSVDRRVRNPLFGFSFGSSSNSLSRPRRSVIL
jgi:hypothetical protein